MLGDALRRRPMPRSGVEFLRGSAALSLVRWPAMHTNLKTMGAGVLFVATALAGCNPEPPPAVPVTEPPPAATVEPAPAPRADCPAGTTWEGDQCVQAAAPEPPPPAKPEPAPAPPAAQAQATFELENGALKLPGPVVFATASDKLKPESDAVLEFVKSYLLAKPVITLLRIEGHTSNEGNSQLNQVLSEKRSLSVAKWLAAHGVDCKRLIAVGFGDSKPIAENSTPEGKAQNRRMSFVNAELKGKAIGGLPVDGGGKVAGNACTP